MINKKAVKSEIFDLAPDINDNICEIIYLNIWINK